MASRKKPVPRWRECSICKAVFDHDNVDSHRKSYCPPMPSWDVGFIFEKCFHSFLKEFEPSNVISGMETSNYDNLIQLSLFAMQICGFVIGDPVLVVQHSGDAIVKIAWPLSDNTLSSVFMTRRGMKEIDYYSGPVIIKQFNNYAPYPVKEVFVKLTEPAFVEEDLVKNALSHANHSLLCDRFIRIGQNICFMYYGLQLVFNVATILPVKCNTEDCTRTITDGFSDMYITGSKQDPLFFKTVSSTSWKLFISSSSERNCEGSRYSKLGGLQKMVSQINEILENVLNGVKKSRGILLHGVSGTGKTLLSRTIARESGLNVVDIVNWNVFSKYYGEAESHLKSAFTDAINNGPSIVLIDELDSFCCNKGGSEQEKRVMMTFLTMLDKLQSSRTLVIATTRQLELVDTAFRRAGRFDYEMEVFVPNADARGEILQCLLEEYKHILTDSDIQLVASSAHGFVGADLQLMCTQASTKAVTDSSDGDVGVYSPITVSHMQWALTVVKPSAMREILVEVPKVKWSDIGGQDELKLQLQQVLEWPMKYPEAFKRLGITPPRGILLFGPPGCSKTMIAKAVATESNLNFMTIKGAELYSKWVGESEKSVRTIFRQARTVAPCVLFFDEIDALAGERGIGDDHSSSSVQERVLSQLLTELDGIQPLSNVSIIAATNRPDRIDCALLRPGRLDRKLYVSLPNEDTRVAIFKLRFSKMPVSDEVDIRQLVQLTEGYSGAEIVSVCHEAAIRALQEDLSASIVNIDHFQYALKTVKPKTPRYLLDIYERFIQNA